MPTYHFESVQLLLDLLSKNRRQTIASSDFTPTIVFSTGPGLVELDARAEADVTRATWSNGSTLRLKSTEFGNRGEVVLTLDLH